MAKSRRRKTNINRVLSGEKTITSMYKPIVNTAVTVALTGAILGATARMLNK